MNITSGKEKEYTDWKANNVDSYGSGIFRYAERWAEMMEDAMDRMDNWLVQHPAKV